MRNGRDGDNEPERGSGVLRSVAPDAPVGKHSIVEVLAGPTMVNRLPPAHRGLGDDVPHLGVGKQTLIERTFGHPAAVNALQSRATTALAGAAAGPGVMQRTAPAGVAPIQKASTGEPQGAKKGTNQYIAFRVTVGRPMTREQFEDAANLQVFGSATVPGRWHNVKDTYTPADSPVEVLFEASLVHRLRGAANAANGIDTDATGKVAGADERAKDFQAQPASGEKARCSPRSTAGTTPRAASRRMRGSSRASRGRRTCGARFATRCCSSTTTSRTCLTG